LIAKLIRGGRLLALAIVVAAFAVAPLAFAGSVTGSADSSGRFWFVQLNSKPTADGGSQAAVNADKAAFRGDAQKADISYSEAFSFGKLWNGLSIRTSASASTLSSLPSVKGVFPVETVSIPPTATVSPDLTTALGMTGADIAQSELGLTGEGIKVGVIDTGIDLDHPALGGDGTPGAPYTNSRVVSQFDFAGDAYNADPSSGSFNPTPTPDPVADDCAGHGTHVSGIVGADGSVTGVAPGVSFGAYRVFGCEGSADTDVILAALERAFTDGMDIVNMSLGSAFNNWPEAPLAQASDVLVNHDVVVVASIGNSGADGLYSAGAPGVGNKVIGVAAFDNVGIHLPYFTVTPANLTIGYTNAAAAPIAPTSGSLPLTKANSVGPVPPGVLPANDGCAAVPAGTYTGMAVLIRRGTCSFYQKARLAELGGASAVVLYNNCPPNCGRFNPTVAVVAGVADGNPVTIPAVAVSDTEGVAIHNAIASGTPQTLNWQSGTQSFPNATGGLISSFSSYGLDAELGLKPDMGAPGGFIRSTYPIELGSYATISGTSMASPHVAGATALLLEAKPGISSQSVRSILQNSADPAPWWGNPGLGFLDNVHRQGAGMLDIDDAILATTKIEPGKLSLGESEAGPATRPLTLTNASGSAVTYDLSHTPALSTGPNTFTVSFFDDFASAAFSSGGVPVSSVVVPARGQATVDVTITAPAGLADKSLYGGYLVFTPQGGGQMYRVPYAGFKGDYQSIQVLTPTAAGYPLLGKLVACNAPAILRGSECFPPFQTPPLPPGVYDPAGALEEYTLVPGLGETPFILAHLNHQARRMRVDLIRVSDSKNMGQAMNEQYLPRDRTATLFSAFPWDGKVTKGNSTSDAPDDVYYFKLTLTRALGDASTAETWTSPNFEIDRPA
jgi:minor extracellular serine protease Vpr